MGIRPESIHEDEAYLAQMPESVVNVDVDLTEMMGAETFLYLKLGEIPLIARVNRRTTAQHGDSIKVAFDANKIHIFDKETEVTIIH